MKPANEPIVLARKPLEKGLSIAQNVLKYGTGGLNIDVSRVGNETRSIPVFSEDIKSDGTQFNLNSQIQHERVETNEGRFPNNVIFTHSAECTCKLYYKTSDSEEVEEEWTCVEDCPVRILDEQSGESTSQVRKPNGQAILRVDQGWNQNSMIDKTERGHTDMGGASRFFYVAKASQSERNFGLNEFEEKRTSAYGYDKGFENAGEGMFKDRNPMKKNTHPTVKPVKLMQYLVRLITPENGIVLDPFNGSGTTGVACKIDGFNYVGMDLSDEYCAIAQARIDTFVEEKEFINDCKIFQSVKNELDGQTSIFDFLTD